MDCRCVCDVCKGEGIEFDDDETDASLAVGVLLGVGMAQVSAVHSWMRSAGTTAP